MKCPKCGETVAGPKIGHVCIDAKNGIVYQMPLRTDDWLTGKDVAYQPEYRSWLEYILAT